MEKNKKCNIKQTKSNTYKSLNYISFYIKYSFKMFNQEKKYESISFNVFLKNA